MSLLSARCFGRASYSPTQLKRWCDVDKRIALGRDFSGIFLIHKKVFSLKAAVVPLKKKKNKPRERTNEKESWIDNLPSLSGWLWVVVDCEDNLSFFFVLETLRRNSLELIMQCRLGEDYQRGLLVAVRLQSRKLIRRKEISAPN